MFLPMQICIAQLQRVKYKRSQKNNVSRNLPHSFPSKRVNALQPPPPHARLHQPLHAPQLAVPVEQILGENATSGQQERESVCDLGRNDSVGVYHVTNIQS